MNSSAYGQVKRIVGEAVEIAAGPGRAAFLAQASETDPSIRNEVETLLAACGDAREFSSAKTGRRK